MKNVHLIGTTINTLQRIEIDEAIRVLNGIVETVKDQRDAGYPADTNPLPTPFGTVCGPTTGEWISANGLEEQPRDSFEWRGVWFVIVGPRGHELVDVLSI